MPKSKKPPPTPYLVPSEVTEKIVQHLATGATVAETAKALAPLLTTRSPYQKVRTTALQHADRIAEMKRQALTLADITPERTMMELGRIAYSDIRDLYDENGCLINPSQLTDDAAATIASVEEESHMEGRGDGAELVRTKKVKRVDKLGALGILARHQKIIGEVGDGVNELANALADRLNATKPPPQLSNEDIAS
jgi:predicted phage gp36 major capsid-like protein